MTFNQTQLSFKFSNTQLLSVSAVWTATLYIQDFHRRLTHLPAVACSNRIFTAFSMAFSSKADQIS